MKWSREKEQLHTPHCGHSCYLPVKTVLEICSWIFLVGVCPYTKQILKSLDLVYVGTILLGAEKINYFHHRLLVVPNHHFKKNLKT